MNTKELAALIAEMDEAQIEQLADALHTIKPRKALDLSKAIAFVDMESMLDRRMAV